MEIEVLVSAVDAPRTLPDTMKLRPPFLVVNQCGRDGALPPFYDSSLHGVGNSRNLAVSKSRGEILLFSDEDMVYDEGYQQKIAEQFCALKDADMILFNVKSLNEQRPLAETQTVRRVHWINCFRYGAVQMAVKRDFIINSGLRFSARFGPGAEYGAGEDSLFISDALKHGGRIYAVPVRIGTARQEKSSWFEGYNEKYFYDKGAFFRAVSGWLFPVLTAYYMICHCDCWKNIGAYRAFKQMMKGAKTYEDQ